MLKKNHVVLLGALALSMPWAAAQAQTKAVIHANVKHTVGGVSTFDRQKYICVHSALSEGDWNGEEKLLDTLMTDLDVYFGRDNGIMILYLNEAAEDPDRPGYVDPSYMKTAGKLRRKVNYGALHADRHVYDGKNDVMIGGQPRAFWPGQSTHPKGSSEGWKLSGGDAMGEYMGRFLNEFYREEGESPTQGPSRPRFLEVLNEPLYYLIDGHRESTVQPKDVFDFHNDVAAGVRRVNDSVLIGGYTAAFPILEERDFARWNERMKLFIDTSGEQMDFFSLHFYDFNNRGDRGRDDYKGARIEATFDMMEQYSRMRLGEVKPFVISEYGGRDHKLENRPWTAVRDWHFLKAATPLFLSFMDRPNLILKSIPFITAKAEWGRKNGVPYNRRLMHQAKERPGQTGDEWIFTDLVMFYELWADVNGTRVESKSDNADVLIDSYVDGRKMYIILSNLNPAEETVSLNLLDRPKSEVSSVKVKHLHRVGDAPELKITEQADPLETFTLDPEASAIIEYTFRKDIVIDQVAEEIKYYATDYNRPIQAGQPVLFEIKDVEIGQSADTVLRIGLGRANDRSRRPVVQFNGTPLNVPKNYSGSEQATRPAFFGLLEIPVPSHLLQADNRISITFPDAGGRVSSVTLKHFTLNSAMQAVQ